MFAQPAAEQRARAIIGSLAGLSLAVTAGNTLGGAISWWMGYAAERTYEHVKKHPPGEARALRWLHRFGPKACLLSWLPAVGGASSSGRLPARLAGEGTGWPVSR